MTSEGKVQIKASGITIHYTVDGVAGDWLVLSNSLATSLSMWDAQAREFSGSFRVLRYDQRGHGTTDALDVWHLDLRARNSKDTRRLSRKRHV